MVVRDGGRRVVVVLVLIVKRMARGRVRRRAQRRERGVGDMNFCNKLHKFNNGMK